MPRPAQNPYADLPPDPLGVLRLWPVDRPLVMLHSGDRGSDPQRARWSILAEPVRWLVVDDDAEDPLQAIVRTIEPHAQPCGARAASPCDRLPFVGGWIGFLSYDVGCAIEPAARGIKRPIDDRKWPLAALAHCPAALVFDHVHQRWSAAGGTDIANDLRARLVASPPSPEAPWCAGDLCSSMTPDEYLSAVSGALEYIAAGDIFQANITQRFTASFDGSARSLARRALAISGSPYGAYLELPGERFIISMSPELFLHVQPCAASRNRTASLDETTRDGRAKPQAAITTRPIKGTRPIACAPNELLNSAKDAAELHMIVDLMRSDLGRVCEYGSVRVTTPRTIETFPGAKVHHGVAEITGTLRRGTSITDLLRATFPAGSITGAPKIRAMQIIDELEPVRRGPYCGAIGFISESGGATFNVAIRTIAISNGTLDYGAGGGIVADSEPAAEYRESQDKAAILRAVLARSAVNEPASAPA